MAMLGVFRHGGCSSWNASHGCDRLAVSEAAYRPVDVAGSGFLHMSRVDCWTLNPIMHFRSPRRQGLKFCSSAAVHLQQLAANGCLDASD